MAKCDYLKDQGEIVVDLHENVIEILTIFDKTTGNFGQSVKKSG